MPTRRVSATERKAQGASPSPPLPDVRSSVLSSGRARRLVAPCADLHSHPSARALVRPCAEAQLCTSGDGGGEGGASPEACGYFRIKRADTQQPRLAAGGGGQLVCSGLARLQRAAVETRRRRRTRARWEAETVAAASAPELEHPCIGLPVWFLPVGHARSSRPVRFSGVRSLQLFVTTCNVFNITEALCSSGNKIDMIFGFIVGVRTSDVGRRRKTSNDGA